MVVNADALPTGMNTSYRVKLHAVCVRALANVRMTQRLRGSQCKHGTFRNAFRGTGKILSKESLVLGVLEIGTYSNIVIYLLATLGDWKLVFNLSTTIFFLRL